MGRAALHRTCSPFIGTLDLVPIPRSSADETDALGVSTRDAQAVESIRRLFARLQEEFGATIFDLYSGAYVDEDTLEEALQRIIGP